MKLPIFNTQGKEVKKIELQDEFFGLKWNDDLMYQVVMAMQTNARQQIAHTKDRSEVRGGGKKPWKQKGTGRARHGSRRSPIWVGGGITFGPRSDKNLDRKINKKAKAKALAIAISQKIRDNELVLIEGAEFKEPKTKIAKEILTVISKNAGAETLATKRKNAGLLAMATKDKNFEKSFANIGSVEVEEVKNINVLDVLKNKYLVVFNAEEGIETLVKRFNVKK